MKKRLWRSGLAAALLAGAGGAAAADLPPSQDPRLMAVVDDLVAANHILYREGVLDGTGHVSVRSPLNPARLLISRARPPGLVSRADIVELDLDCKPAGATASDTPLYGERFLHCETLRARPDLNAVIHSHAKASVAFSVMDTPLRAIMQTAAFLPPQGVPVFDGSREVRPGQTMIVDRPLAAAMVARLGRSSVVLLRSHGNVVAGLNIPNAVERALYTEWNARTLLDVMAARPGAITYLSAREIAEQGAYQAASTAYRNWQALRATEEASRAR